MGTTTGVAALAAGERVTLATRDGVALAGRWWPAAGPARAAAVVAHGFTAHKDEPRVVATALALRDAGFDVLAYDGRGHGESGGLCTLGDAERLDVAAAVAAASVAGRPVVAIGASMGAVAVLRHAVENPRLGGVVLVSCPARWRLHSARSVLAAGLTMTRPGRWFVASRMGVRLAPRWTNPLPPEALAGLVPGPLAIVHGRDDRFMPVAEAERLHRRARGPRRIEIVPDMGHAYDEAAIPAIVAAAEWALAASAAGDRDRPR
jgi:pimeloyl-ACP methyl ester carboxylesterase